MTAPAGKRLEHYTRQYPQEVLLVAANIAGEQDQIAIYKGFSSSLMRATDADPDVPLLPESAQIVSIDRVATPYDPDNPQYIQRGLSWAEMESLLAQAGV